MNPGGDGPVPSFNLWTDGWISVQRFDRTLERLSLRGCIRSAHECVTLCDNSPLVDVGIHRLLVAILQATLEPNSLSRLWEILKAGRFPTGPVERFGSEYGARFDIFSSDRPFLQTADLPAVPSRGDVLKSVSQLTMETSATSALDHYRHGRALDEFFCPSCLAGGLSTIAPFATTGGRGFRPSINGVPPLYVFPGGRNLLESLALSLLLPENRPAAAFGSHDAPAWDRDPVVALSGEMLEIGYLQGLTWAARRVRLQPERMTMPCTRCGTESDWGARTMIFEMGESRSRSAVPWLDPFVAYRIADDDDDAKRAKRARHAPVRLAEAKAVWREFGGLLLEPGFAQYPEFSSDWQTVRPGILDQVAQVLQEEGSDARTATLPVRCVGVRTDRKTKCFEWIDATLDLPLSLLKTPELASPVRRSLELAERVADAIARVFAVVFVRDETARRFTRLRQRMVDQYWENLAEPFRSLVLSIEKADDPREAWLGWERAIRDLAYQAFQRAVAAVGGQGSVSLLRAEAETRCGVELARIIREYEDHPRVQ